MSKAKKFIDDCTKNCSNVVAYSGMIEGSELRYHEWLTPDQARKAVEIAREEAIMKAIEWIEQNAHRYLVTRRINGINMTALDVSISDDFRNTMNYE